MVQRMIISLQGSLRTYFKQEAACLGPEGVAVRSECSIKLLAAAGPWAARV